ncbi:unnamed protein product [Lactuca saligna]|uniref:PPM-type phosphatase domain-containing protein n=1 Tax=Lactuca saligna TaxID=75948 RepID=A0AA35ZS79_LACSI|nr:unnamed protein product [Lactuca saligna]
MGNGVGKLTICFTGTDIVQRRKDLAFVISDPLDDLGHSFCYVRPDQSCISSSKVHSAEETTTFRSISGASVSANTSTPLSTSFLDVYSYNTSDKASAFESSTSFASIPLQPLPRNSINSGPLPFGPGAYSGPMDRGFVSGPIERGFQSGPLFSGPLEKGNLDQFQRSYSHGGFGFKRRSRKGNLIRAIQKAISMTFTTRGQNSTVAPITKNLGHLKDHDWNVGARISSGRKAKQEKIECTSSYRRNMAVHKELKGLLWDDQTDASNSTSSGQSLDTVDSHSNSQPQKNSSPRYVHQQESYPCATEDLETNSRKKRNNIRNRGAAKKWEENQRRWKCEFDRERLELDRRLREHMNSNGSNSINHSDVLKALSQGLKKTEEAYLDIADQMLDENPELALMGSCVLVMLMKGEDVYVMNVGDSRAVLAQKSEPDIWRQDLEKINEETWYDLEVFDADIATTDPSLTACQLSMDHSTSIEEEVKRIKSEHPEDACAVMNDRVKGSLKVTRAFGAGFLKQPKWNNALLEMFRIDYVGTTPYINCLPYLHHHKLGPRDRFLILSSDGLYQYFTNEEAVSEVELFIQWSPEGDPAQHLVEEVLLRAAKKAGLDFHELLEIPQGDRRRYHDDVSIIVISLEGRIWRSCV